MPTRPAASSRSRCFDNAVGAGIEWVEINSNWEETLMIVLTDHGNGMPMGPDSDEIAFQAIENNGQGVLPGVQHSGGHTTENTLFWAEGAGSELFMQEIVGTDQVLGFNDGSYIDNSSVYGVMKTAALGASVAPVPLPAAGAARRRSRRPAGAAAQARGLTGDPVARTGPWTGPDLARGRPSPAPAAPARRAGATGPGA